MLGVLATFSNVFITLAWLAIIMITMWAFIKFRPEWIWYCIAASPVMEVWARMTKAPMLPYETGKYYLLIAIIALLMLKLRGHKGYSQHSPGFWIIATIVPSLIVNIVVFDYDQWVFNALGIIDLALLLILAAFERWSIERFCRTLQFALIPIVSVVIYLMLSASNFSKIAFELKANSAASGGFASNQVSTIIGTSIVLLLLLQLLKRPLFTFRMFNLALLMLLIFRGFLTFSRGGMVVAGVAVLIALSPNFVSSLRSFLRFSLIGAGIVLVSFFVFQKVNRMTGNMLLMRYQGDTYSTVRGFREKDVNTITSGRGDVVLSDLLIFKDNPAFGVGPGISKSLRYKYGYQNIAAHTEFTRLLSEHGTGGVLIIGILLLFPVWWLRKQRIATWRGVVAALFAVAILTTFHAAMRTNTSIVMYALAAIPVFYYATRKIEGHEKEDIVHRQ